MKKLFTLLCFCAFASATLLAQTQVVATNSTSLCAPDGTTYEFNAANGTYEATNSDNFLSDDGTNWILQIPFLFGSFTRAAIGPLSADGPIGAYATDNQQGPTCGADTNFDIADATTAPVTLTRFAGSFNSKVIALDWATASESGNEGFEVQRSADGVNWSALNFVASRNGANGAATYDFVDEAPLPGANFYRLKQMDLDGAFDFSPTIIVEADLAEGAVSVFPNPVDNVLNVRTSKEGVSTYRIINAQGAVVLEGKLSSGQSVDVQGLRAGNYVLSVDGQTTRRFVKK